ncbi:Lrp/AsnC family transcriptional regulator [Octadecabacter sp. 1_MG-2023]|uniref:Lrp/AsnC family transcriptional regulator n=1 Tax=unclassified Octadecabacter TaxID=196158 RepID=UPI001C09FFA6|nr:MULTISPECIES: Lrp/AsnC family transcriptional regulator [unclassified Octadecabacter]MBU2994156.1 Lrp/AsnC family transcriptional regulator [Octadecabacter sp. B2R22]MDO6734555.1 Lrp/AsnC family transcriptional regulator [Octadecabacter sp. 1_MG-2023]
MTSKLDTIDHKILSILQKDTMCSVDTISEQVALSRNACWRRIKAMEANGVIRARVALLDASKIGCPLTALVLIRTDHHSDAWRRDFAVAVAALPEITTAQRMTGDLDYVLTVRLADVAAYDHFYKRLTSRISVSDISASFVMEDIKDTTALPL